MCLSLSFSLTNSLTSCFCLFLPISSMSTSVSFPLLARQIKLHKNTVSFLVSLQLGHLYCRSLLTRFKPYVCLKRPVSSLSPLCPCSDCVGFCPWESVYHIGFFVIINLAHESVTTGTKVGSSQKSKGKCLVFPVCIVDVFLSHTLFIHISASVSRLDVDVQSGVINVQSVLVISLIVKHLTDIIVCSQQLFFCNQAGKSFLVVMFINVIHFFNHFYIFTIRC